MTEDEAIERLRVKRYDLGKSVYMGAGVVTEDRLSSTFHRTPDGHMLPSAHSWLRGLALTQEPENERGRRALAHVLLDVQEIAQENGPDACQRILDRIEEIARPVTVKRIT